jgi:hypothetical protein
VTATMTNAPTDYTPEAIETIHRRLAAARYGAHTIQIAMATLYGPLADQRDSRERILAAERQAQALEAELATVQARFLTRYPRRRRPTARWYAQQVHRFAQRVLTR